MTVSNHTALYRIGFPGTLSNDSLPYSPLILVDLTDLSDSRSNGSISVDAETGRIVGSGTFNPSFGIGTFDLHFCADFQGAAIRDTGIFQNNRPGREPKSLRTHGTGTTEPVPAGAWVQFYPPDEDDQILVRVGLSYISTDQACANAEREVPGPFGFDATKSAAEDAWRSKLGVITVDPAGVNSTFLTTFWSGAYRSLISPQDLTAENPLWESSEPCKSEMVTANLQGSQADEYADYDSFYCIWDSYRSIHPFITLVDPLSQTLMVRSLIDIYRFEGYLPDCRMDLCKGYTQGGSNADVVLADTFAKGFRDGIDWEIGYQAVLKDAEGMWLLLPR